MTNQDSAHRLIDAVADRLITRDMAHAYLAADLQPAQLDAILEAHRNPPASPAPLIPGQLIPPRPPFPPATYPGIPNAIPTPWPKRDPLNPPWIITSQTQRWPGAAIQHGKLVGGWIEPYRARYWPPHDSEPAEQNAP